MARRLAAVFTATIAFLVAGASAAMACGGLIGPRGSVNLLRTTTLAAYHQGVEHYVTSFTFNGIGGGKFGSLVPLPGVPSTVERGGDWTLQRLLREVAPPQREFLAPTAALFASEDRAQVLLETKVDALDITILKGGGPEVARWATDNGFELPPDSPEVLDFYARRSPIFMAARFDAAEARRRGQLAGDGTPIHLTIPTPNPWVPLRILALGKQTLEPVQADVFLLTEREPAILPRATNARGVEPVAAGLVRERSERASDSLLEDLAGDKGMGWLPATGMWLSYFKLDARAGDVGYDLAIDASGFEQPSPVAAGLADAVREAARASAPAWPGLLVLALVALLAAIVGRRRTQPVG